MDTADEDELALTKLSVDLLSDLERQLRTLLYKRYHNDAKTLRLHRSARLKHLNSIIKLIEPFQSDPQLLDPKLKNIVPLVAQAYLQHVICSQQSVDRAGNVDILTALSSILYTLCKVRGKKVISGLLNNEPRYLEPILNRLEAVAAQDDTWHIQYVLLLWLSHLLLTPFDLASISNDQAMNTKVADLSVPDDTPTIICRVLEACLPYLSQSAATQQVAATALARLALRPDTQRYQIAGALVTRSLSAVADQRQPIGLEKHAVLGYMRFLGSITRSSEAADLLPSIYSTYTQHMSEKTSDLITLDAVGRNLLIKTVRNIVTTSLRAVSHVELQVFIGNGDVLESTIDFLIRALSDKETSVRHSAAKALSVIVLELEAAMGEEIVSVVLSSLQEELPDSTQDNIYETADSSTCHGCTLALAFALFKRSVPTGQLASIASTLLRALTFVQKTATGAVTGTNIRDSANFGLWSLSRRYTTFELEAAGSVSGTSIIQTIAIHLLQSACCDPVGNIRRGSSAALQELIGRHPDQIPHGIALVQAVDYLAVGLRRRAMVGVASQVMQMAKLYWQPMMDCLLGWRGLGSVDLPSRDAAATAITQQLMLADATAKQQIIRSLVSRLSRCASTDVELRHGFTLTLAMLAEASALVNTAVDSKVISITRLWESVVPSLDTAFTARAVKAQVPVAIARLAAALQLECLHKPEAECTQHASLEGLKDFFNNLVARSEGFVMAGIASLTNSMFRHGQAHDVVDVLLTHVKKDSSKPTVKGAGRTCALACLVRIAQRSEDRSAALQGVLTACRSTHIDWRIAGSKALGVVLHFDTKHEPLEQTDVRRIIDVVMAGLQDHTIDERGDIGSHVRLQAIARAQSLFEQPELGLSMDEIVRLDAAILRLSLEKLGKVQAQAAICRSVLLEQSVRIEQPLETESVEYFEAALQPLWHTSTPLWAIDALLEGLVSCAGSGAEHVMQNARLVLATGLRSCSISHLKHLITVYATILRDMTSKSTNIQPALELLSFLLQMNLLAALQDTDFKLRTLLAIVQKLHFKSTDVPRILAAVSAYAGLGTFDSIKEDVLKKLLSMLKTSPYPKVRGAVADVIFALTHDEQLKKRDWSKPALQNSSTLNLIQRRLLPR